MNDNEVETDEGIEESKDQHISLAFHDNNYHTSQKEESPLHFGGSYRGLMRQNNMR
jgi:hypothetical protein